MALDPVTVDYLRTHFSNGVVDRHREYKNLVTQLITDIRLDPTEARAKGTLALKQKLDDAYKRYNFSAIALQEFDKDFTLTQIDWPNELLNGLKNPGVRGRFKFVIKHKEGNEVLNLMHLSPLEIYATLRKKIKKNILENLVGAYQHQLENLPFMLMGVSGSSILDREIIIHESSGEVLANFEHHEVKVDNFLIPSVIHYTFKLVDNPEQKKPTRVFRLQGLFANLDFSERIFNFPVIPGPDMFRMNKMTFEDNEIILLSREIEELRRLVSQSRPNKSLIPYEEIEKLISETISLVEDHEDPLIPIPLLREGVDIIKQYAQGNFDIANKRAQAFLNKIHPKTDYAKIAQGLFFAFAAIGCCVMSFWTFGVPLIFGIPLLIHAIKNHFLKADTHYYIEGFSKLSRHPIWKSEVEIQKTCANNPL